MLLRKVGRFASLKDSVPHGSRKVFRVIEVIEHFSTIACWIWFFISICVLFSFETPTTELGISKLVLMTCLLSMIPLTMLSTSITTALFELISDVAIDIRRLRLIHQQSNQIEWEDR